MDLRIQRAQTAAGKPGTSTSGRRQATGFATGNSDHCLRRGARRKHRQEHCFRAGSESQADLLRKLPRRVRAGISRVLSDSPARGTAAGIPEEPGAGFRRAQAHQQHHVPCVPHPQSGDAGRARRRLSRPQSKTAHQRRSKELLASGKKIYDEGIPESDVPPCASCHGPEAKGDGQFPRLAGQLSDYVVNKLKNWTKERGQDPKNPDASAIMQPIAHGLTDQQIKAVAAFLNHQE